MDKHHWKIMYFHKFFVLLCLCSLGASFGKSVDQKNLKIELVQVLFRHGARTPVLCEAVFVDNNKTLYEPWGMGQLTNQGMTQEYLIGDMLRKRYDDFLTNVYKPEFVYAYASGVSRTKASLELVLASLFPATGKLVWNLNFRWLPVPTYSNPRSLDILIKSRDCPRYVQALKEVLNTTEVKKLVDQHDNTFKYMEKVHGKKLYFNDIFCGYNALVVHKNLNLPLPSWHSDELFAKLADVSKLYLDLLAHTTTMRRLSGGPFVRRFVENMENAERKNPEGRKIYLYSAHDKTLYAFAKAHNLTLEESPDYGSAIILEKLRDENDKLYVRMLLWSGDPKTLRTLKFEGCAQICEMDKYMRIVSPVLPEDEEMQCLFNNLSPKNIENILHTDINNIKD